MSLSTSRIWVALGSNLGDRESHLLQGFQNIVDLPSCSNLVRSSIYETSPMGPSEQPDYLNAVCAFDSHLEPLALLSELKRIERQHGRIQATQRWSARPLDLDILLYAEQLINVPELTIPHVGIAHRSFVLWPMAELDDQLQIPSLGAVAELMKHCERYGIKRYSSGAGSTSA